LYKEQGIKGYVNMEFEIALSVYNNSLDVMKVLLKYDEDITIYRIIDFLIKLACDKGYLKIVEYLMSYDKVDLNKKTENLISIKNVNIGNFALCHSLIEIALYHENADMIKLLLNDKRVDVSDICNNLYKIYQKGNMKIFQLLLENERIIGTDIDINNILIDCLEIRKPDIALLLLNNHRSIDSYIDECAIILASKEGYFSIVQLLLNYKRIDPCIYDNESIKIAAEYGHENITKLLLKYSKCKNENIELTLFRIAIKNKQINVVKLLLCAENKYSKDVYQTIFSYAAEHNNIDAVKMILYNDNAINSDIKIYARRLAFRKGYTQIMQILNEV
jgi:ankyrin repeat protein